jgi:hypothetical protein
LAYRSGGGLSSGLRGPPHPSPAPTEPGWPPRPIIGCGFRALRLRLGASELVENRRQQQAWEREALDLIRSGLVEEAVAAYRAHDRVVAADSKPAATLALLQDWWTTSSTWDGSGRWAPRWCRSAARAPSTGSASPGSSPSSLPACDGPAATPPSGGADRCRPSRCRSIGLPHASSSGGRRLRATLGLGRAGRQPVRPGPIGSGDLLPNHRMSLPVFGVGPPGTPTSLPPPSPRSPEPPDPAAVGTITARPDRRSRPGWPGPGPWPARPAAGRWPAAPAGGRHRSLAGPGGPPGC